MFESVIHYHAVLPTYTTWHRRCTTNSHTTLNSLAPGRSGFNFKSAIFNLVLLIGIFRSSYDNALRWMSRDLSEDESTLVQVMAWCRQATSHYLSQCWPRSLSPYGVTRAPSFDKICPYRNGKILTAYLIICWWPICLIGLFITGPVIVICLCSRSSMTVY